MLTKDEFELLCCLEKAGKHLPQRQLAEALDISLGKINKLLKALTEKEYCDQNGITQGGAGCPGAIPCPACNLSGRRL